MNDTFTTKDIQQHYKAAMDSVNLINACQPESMPNEELASFLQQ